MSKEAMKLALEALEHCKDVIVERGLNGSPEFAKKWGLTLPLERSEKAIIALREALAEQPAQRQEPVAMDAVYAAWHGAGVDIAGGNWSRFVGMLPALYTSSPAQQQQEPVSFLANGTRFKISYDSRQSGGQIHGIPPDLGGRWVAFVAADDDCHLKLMSPPQRKPLTRDQVKKMMFKNGYDQASPQERSDFINGIRHGESAHGIKENT